MKFARGAVTNRRIGIIITDSSPIMGLTTVAGLYVNCGSGMGGVKGNPAGARESHKPARGAPP